ncbi:hypothetical protein AAG570_012620 [Ranatra chinensis]|uniref:Bardet-Biedl syndrome 4 n=1 Tax=Ranatra chinensis TaxID=642074 RepID=A0ABD0YEC8_9HEMI
MESNNWLIHTRYARKEFDICKLLIEEEFENNDGCNEYANYVMGLILRHEGKVQESLEYFQKCHLLNPTNSDNVKQIGCSMYILGRHNIAIEAYLRADKVSGSPDWNIHHKLGECYLSVGRLGKARDHLKKAVHLGRAEQSYKSLAELFIAENDVNSAFEIYNTALELFPTSSDIASELGLLYLKVGELQKAFDKLGTAIAISPNNTKALLPMASIFQEHEDYDVALSKYKISGQFLPESVSLWNNMGMCFFGKGKFVAAISCLKRANYLNPLDWKTLFNLGLVHLHTKQYASAFIYLSSGIKLQHKHAPSFMLLAISLKHLGDNDNAIKCFEQGIKLDPDDAALRVNYITHLCSIGKNNEATEQLNILQIFLQQQPNIEEGVSC